MKKMLYIGHNYHNKTKSTEFLIELFKEKYIVEEADHTIYSNDISIQKNLKNNPEYFFPCMTAAQITKIRSGKIIRTF